MRWFYFSIIAVVLGAIFAIGWGVDLLVGETQPQHSAEVGVYRQAIDGVAAQLGRLPPEKLSQGVDLLSQDFNLSITLVDSESIALPPSLTQKLSEAGGLYLVSEQESYLLKRIAQHDDYLLQLRLPMLAEQVDFSNDLILTIMLYLGVSLIIVLWTFPLTRRLHLLNNMSAKFGEIGLLFLADFDKASSCQTRFTFLYIAEKSRK